jgi:hypothetical protein
VYRDNNHVTATYMRSVTPLLELAMLDKVPELMTVTKRSNTTANAAPTFVTLQRVNSAPKAKAKGKAKQVVKPALPAEAKALR